MNIVNKIDKPCVIYRSDIDQHMQFGNKVIIFKDSDQALAFSEYFPMFFVSDKEETPFGIYQASEEMLNDKEYIVCYDDIADRMEKEREYQINKVMKGALKDE